MNKRSPTPDTMPEGMDRRRFLGTAAVARAGLAAIAGCNENPSADAGKAAPATAGTPPSTPRISSPTV